MEENRTCETCAWGRGGRVCLANCEPVEELDYDACHQYTKYVDSDAEPEVHIEPAQETNVQPTEHDAVNNPSHYTHGGIECIDALKAALGVNFIGFLIGNVIKYCWRYRHKNGKEDLKKAAWYLERAIKEVDENG